MGLFERFKKKQEPVEVQPHFENQPILKHTFSGATLEPSPDGRVKIYNTVIENNKEKKVGLNTSEVKEIKYRYNPNDKKFSVDVITKSNSLYTVYDADLQLIDKMENVPTAFQHLKEANEMNKIDITPQQSALERLTEEVKKNNVNRLSGYHISDSIENRIQFVDKDDRFITLTVDHMYLSKEKNTYDLMVNSKGKNYIFEDMKKHDLDNIASTVPFKDNVMNTYYTEEHTKKMNHVSKIERSSPSRSISKGLGH